MNKSRIIDYVIKLDGEFHKAFATLREARNYIKDLPVKIGISKMPKEVLLIKKIEENRILNTYTPKTTVVLESDKTFDDINFV